MNTALNASQITEQIRALPTEERQKVMENTLRHCSAAERKAVERLLRRLQNPDIPDDFWEGVEDIEEGRTVDMEVALNEPYPRRPV